MGDGEPLVTSTLASEACLEVEIFTEGGVLVSFELDFHQMNHACRGTLTWKLWITRLRSDQCEHTHVLLELAFSAVLNTFSVVS
jgi:hypothetical protein